MNIRLLKKLVLVSMVLCLILIISGCAQQAGSTVNSTSAPVSAPKPQSGGTIKVGVAGDAFNIGFPAEKRVISDYFNSRPCIESLGGFDATGNLVPLLATSWQIDATTKTMTISLRKSVKFHDGTDFNADACKWNLDQFITASRSEFKSVKSIDVVDGYTVRLNLNTWDNAIINNVIYYGEMISPAAFKLNGKDWCINNPVGTGPFKFISWQRDVSVKYTKFSNYWQQGKPYLDGVEITVIKDPMTMLAAFKAKEIDIVRDISPKDVAGFTPPNFEIVKLKSGLGAALFSLMGDSIHPNSPYANIKVRQAIGYAIDSKTITDSLLSGFGVPTNQWALPGNWAYNPDVKGQPYNPDKAKQLLSEAGYASGFKTTLTVIGIPDWVTQMTAVQGYLVKAGIDTKVDVVDPGKFNELTRTSTWANGLMLGFSKMDADPVGMIPGTFSTSGLAYSKSLIHPEPLEKLMETAKTAPDLATKKKYAWDLQKMIYDEYTITTPLYVPQLLAAKYAKIHNDGINVTESTEWTPEETWISP